jgi:hypothetical protein
MEDDRRAGAGVDMELEDVGTMVVADRVEISPRGPYGSEIDIGVEDGLLVPRRSCQDAAGGVDDDAVPGSTQASWSARLTRSRCGNSAGI